MGAATTVDGSEQRPEPRIKTSFRPTVMGVNGAVTSGHPLASVAGLEILQAGGTAADAIVAMAAAVGVVEPNMSGVGGDGFTLYYEAATKSVTTVNGTGPAPNRATIEAYADGIPRRGPRSVSVPGAVAGWMAVHQRWGKLELERVMQSGIRLAEEGFPVSHNLATDLANASSDLGAFDQCRAIFLANGAPPAAGSVLRQQALGRTLREIALTGGESLYRGALAERLTAAIREAGGLIDADSMAAFDPEVTTPLTVAYRGLQAFEPGPNSSGHVLLQELAMTQFLDLRSWRSPSAQLIHHLVEVKKLAFEDRERFCADPRYSGDLPDHLLSPEYARKRLRLVDPESASSALVPIQSEGDTTYLAAIDRDGNIASMTTSINMSFGSAFVAGDTGILMNNRMCYWHLDPAHPNALEPGKRVRHTVSPAVLLRGGEPAMAIGTPGADGQVQTIFQVLVNVLDYGMHPQQAVEAPRWRSFTDHQDANWPHRHANELHVEGRMPASVIEGLQARGHVVVRDEPWATGFGSVQLIQVDPKGVLAVGSDPRRDAYGLAF